MQRRLHISTPISVAFPHRPSAHPRRRISPRVAFDAFDTDFDPQALEAEGIREDEFIREFDSILNQANYKFEVGQMVEGLVFDVDDSGVYVDFGGKEMGYCSGKNLGLKKVSRPGELVRVNSRRLFEIRQTGVKIKKMGGEVTLLSREKLVGEIAWKRLRQMYDSRAKIEVTVMRKNYGGYVVQDDMGLDGFLPGGQASINPAISSLEDDGILGRRITVRILDIFVESNRYTVTQRGIVDMSVDYDIGSIVEGYVEGIMPYGVFVRAGEISGLVHTSQISSTHVPDAKEIFTVGDKVKVMVLGYDQKRGQLSLSTKKLEPVPGAMMKDPQSVYARAEEMAEKFKEQVKEAHQRMNLGLSPITSDVSVNTARLAARRKSGARKAA